MKGKILTILSVLIILFSLAVAAQDYGSIGSGSDYGNIGSGYDYGNIGSGYDYGNTGGGYDYGSIGGGNYPYPSVNAPAQWFSLPNVVIPANSADGTLIQQDIYSKCYDPDSTVVISIISDPVNYDLYFSDMIKPNILIKSLNSAYAGTETIVLSCNGVLANFQLTVTPGVTNLPPVANAGLDQNVAVNTVVNFNGAASYDPDGTIVSYQWNFNDGTTANGVAVTHTYSVANTYTVTLTVTDNNGATNSDTTVITVGSLPANQPPVADAGNDRTVNVNAAITLDGSLSYDLDGTIVSYQWNLGDGRTVNGVSGLIAYNTPGTYTVTLTVIDDDGAQDTDSITIIADGMPTAIVGGPYGGYLHEWILFNAEDSTDNGFITNYHWDFGDGWMIDTQTPYVYHAYDEIGVYTVTLIVTDNDGLTDSDTTTAAITDASNFYPVVSFTYTPANPVAEETITFTDQSTDPDGYIAEWEWDFGDGSLSTQRNPTHQYDEPGTYLVYLTVVDNNGYSSTLSQNLIVLASPDDEDGQKKEDRTIFERVRFNEQVQAGDILALSVNLFNDGSSDMKDTQVTAYIFGLEIWKTVGPFDLDNGEEENAQLYLDIPEDAEPGEYDVRIVASNDNYRRIEHRVVTIQ